MSSRRRGRLITFEGLEGAGKSTQAEILKTFLEERRIMVTVTREPGGVPAGEVVRKLLLDRSIRLSAEGELLLFFAVRAEHVREVIKPALAQGQWVICDRFTDSSYAYQGGGRNIPTHCIDALSELAVADLRPDLTLFLDLPPEQIAVRISGRHQADRFESEGTAFFEQVRAVYLELAAREPQRIRTVNAGLAQEEVAHAIITEVEPLLAGGSGS